MECHERSGSTVAAPATQREDGVQPYAASLSVFDPDGQAVTGFFGSLADKPGLGADLVAHLHAKAATLRTTA